MIFKTVNYVNDEGNVIVALEPIEVPSLIPPKRMGIVELGTNMGPMKVQFPFTEEKTLEECFANFEKRAEEFFEKLQREQNSKIVTPDQVRGSGLIIPK